MNLRFAMAWTILLCAALAGCGNIASIGTGVGVMPVSDRPTPKGPRQVIYRIDEARYITIEDYTDCTVGGIMVWHDERHDLHSVMSPFKDGGNGFWPGRFVIDPGEQRLAIATFGCGDRNCHLWITFSNDGGKTWDKFPSEQYSRYIWKESFSYRHKLLDTDVRVTKKGLVYVIPEHQTFFTRYRLDGTKEQRPASTANIDHDSGSYNDRDVASIPNVATPSGQERFTCDTSLNPPRQD